MLREGSLSLKLCTSILLINNDKYWNMQNFKTKVCGSNKDHPKNTWLANITAIEKFTADLKEWLVDAKMKTCLHGESK